MNSIEIQISSIGNNINLLIDTINYKLITHDQEKTITKEQLDELIRIIRTWKSVYQKTNNEIDTETFTININTNEGIETITGNGEYPDNYIAFKEWIGEFYD